MAESELESLLRRGLVEVSLTGQNVDRVLDERLRSLRQYLRQDPVSGADLRLLLDDIDQIQQGLDAKKEQWSTTIASSVRDITRPMVDQGLNQGKVREELAPLQDRDFCFLELEPVLDRIARLANNLSENTSNHPHLQLVRQKVQMLVRNLKVPTELEGQKQQWLQDLELEPSKLQIGQILDQLSQFVIDLINREQESLKHYLEELVAPLAEIEQLMQASEQHLNHTDDLQVTFSNKFESGIKDLKSQLGGTHDLPSLKELLHRRLEGLTHDFADYTRERTNLEKQMLDQYAQMKAELVKLREAQQAAMEQIARYQQQSVTDALTNLPNRHAWDQYLTSEWQRFYRYGHDLCLAVVDIDFFKKINDTHGHQTGDMVLKAVALQLRKYLRSTDIIARYGGEEFALLLPDTGLMDAETALNHVRKKIEKARFKTKDSEIRMTVSIGICMAEKSLSPQLMFEKADEALYEAKNQGRNQVRISSK